MLETDYAKISHTAINQLLTDRDNLLKVADELSLALSTKQGKQNEIDFAQIVLADLKAEFEARKNGVAKPSSYTHMSDGTIFPNG